MNNIPLLLIWFVLFTSWLVGRARPLTFCIRRPILDRRRTERSPALGHPLVPTPGGFLAAPPSSPRPRDGRRMGDDPSAAPCHGSFASSSNIRSGGGVVTRCWSNPLHHHHHEEKEDDLGATGGAATTAALLRTVTFCLPRNREPDLLCEWLMEIGAVATALTDANAGTSQEHAIFGEPLVGTVHGGAYSRHSVWNVCNVTAWFADSVNLTQVVELVRTSSSSSFLAEESPEDKTSGELLDFKIQTVDDRDWIVHVQQSWKPVVVGRFVLKFPWHDEHTVQHALQLSLSVGDPVASDNDDPKRTSTVDPPIVLELQGGVAFGTGEHATTQLCLEWIESTVTEHLSRSGDGGGSSYSSSADDDNAATPRVQVLDYGAGSGILGMAACALDPAAVSCVGIDIDVDACRIANDNANRNRLDMRTYLPPTSLLQTHPDDAESQSLLLKAHRQAILFPRRRYDDAGGERDGAESDVVLPDELDMQQFPIVVANILAAPLTQLAPSLMRRVEPGGRLGLSGVLHHQAESVLRAYQQEGLEKGRVQERLGDWVLITGTKAS